MIADNKVVSLNYTVKDEADQVIDSSEGAEPLTYLHGANNIIPGLEAALVGKSAGDEFAATVAPADGYGEYNEALVQVVPRSELKALKK